jgi:hypothetical protein
MSLDRADYFRGDRVAWCMKIASQHVVLGKANQLRQDHVFCDMNIILLNSLNTFKRGKKLKLTVSKEIA